MSALIPEDFVTAMAKKITFKRMSSKNVIAYEIYTKYIDENHPGPRVELLDTVPNDPPMDPPLKRMELEYTSSAKWKLPDDAFLDRDHWFRLYLNDIILSEMFYNYNRVLKWFSLDLVAKDYTVNDKLELEYDRNVITKTYLVEDNCQIKITPIWRDSYAVGTHNIIM